DVYFSVVNVTSGQLLRNDVAPSSRMPRINLGPIAWSKSFKFEPMGLDLTFGIEVTGEIKKEDCNAGANIKIEPSGQIENDDYSFNLKGTGEGDFKYDVNPDECEWEYNSDASAANFGITATFAA